MASPLGHSTNTTSSPYFVAYSLLSESTNGNSPTHRKMRFTLFLLTSVSIFPLVLGDCDWTFCMLQECATASNQGDCLCGYSNVTTESVIDACIVGQCPDLTVAESQEKLAATCCSKSCYQEFN